MPALLIHHRDIVFEHWYPAFLEHVDVRQTYGAITEMILRDAQSPNDVWVLIQWDDLHRAQLFERSEDLQDQLDQAGVVISPEIRILEVLDSGDLRAQVQPGEAGGSPFEGNDQGPAPDR